MTYTYLALGDSYTIGEQVPSQDSFPHQTVNLLRGMKLEVAEPLIVATTGWTTDELAAAIRERHIHGTYSFVTLLIGVNNQYRGRSIDNYRSEFLDLLRQAIAFAGGSAQHVFVLSIPDWGVTPFAEGRDKVQIAHSIDEYNAACREIALANNCHHIDITDSTRLNGQKEEYLVADALHPSRKEYAIWAKRLADRVVGVLQWQRK